MMQIQGDILAQNSDIPDLTAFCEGNLRKPVYLYLNDGKGRNQGCFPSLGKTYH